MFRLAKFANATGQRWKYRVWVAATAAAIIISVAFSSLWSGNPARLPEGLTIADIRAFLANWCNDKRLTGVHQNIYH